MLHSLFDPRLSKLAMTPFGRTRPIDQSARRVLYGDTVDGAGTAFLTVYSHLFMLAILFLGFVVARLGGQFDVDALVFLAVIPLGLPLWALACWQIRRLHDIGRSGFNLAKPLAIHGGRWLATLIGSMLLLFTLFNVATHFRDTDSIWAAGGLAISPLVAGLGIWLAYGRWLLEPHRKRWRADVEQAPGDPLENRFGPPPK